MSKENSYLRFLKGVKKLVDSEMEKESPKEKELTPKERSDIWKKEIIEYFSQDTTMVSSFSMNQSPIETSRLGDLGYSTYRFDNTIHITINTKKP